MHESDLNQPNKSAYVGKLIYKLFKRVDLIDQYYCEQFVGLVRSYYYVTEMILFF